MKKKKPTIWDENFVPEERPIYTALVRFVANHYFLFDFVVEILFPITLAVLIYKVLWWFF